MTSKEYFLSRVVRDLVAEKGEGIKILEIGCGTANYVPKVLAEFPKVTYVGIEPIKESFAAAQKNLVDQPNVKVFYQLGYERCSEIEGIEFDLVISFSVLEHVKQLGKFMAFAASCLAKDGLMVHRYDLGHALYPGSLKERFHVFLGNTFPQVLPETKFVRYVPKQEVADEFAKVLGNAPYQYTYHQMPNVKKLEKLCVAKNVREGDMFQTFYEWEFAYARQLDQLPTEKLELLFPTVAVWGRRG